MILVTGGTGYIGSHACVALAKAGFKTLILDNLSNSQVQVLDRLESIFGTRPGFIEGDVRDSGLLDDIFRNYAIDSVIHFAGLKAVGESVALPLDYYDNNVTGSLSLLAAMRRAEIKTFIFSSSATVYGDPRDVPISEGCALRPTNPYGRSKLIVEEILADLSNAEPQWKIARLRYFNPVGAHESGLIGESPQGKPNNLMPMVSQVAVGRRDKLLVFGSDYPTPDGTGIRDYIHVMDLAEGHVAALKYCRSNEGLFTANLGTGQGYSVLDVIRTFEAENRCRVPYEIVERRPGDIAQCWADPTIARKILGWQATRELKQMCRDAWRWQQENPRGLE